MIDELEIGYREGDFIETREGLIFDVKGLVHPTDKVIAFVRYVPCPQGDRERKGRKFKKIYVLKQRYQYLQDNFPQYLSYDEVFDEDLSRVPRKFIAYHYQPQKKTHELLIKRHPDLLEKQTVEFIQRIRELTDIPLQSIGVSGSVLVHLPSEKSDIDLIIYGTKNGYALQKRLRNIMGHRNTIKPYDRGTLRQFFQERHQRTNISFKDYYSHEARKSFQGTFNQRDFFIRYVRDWSEIREKYGDIKYTNEGYAKIQGRITDDSEAIFTPCSYQVADSKILSGKRVSPITELASFRGRFCEQALKDEWIIAQGKLEKVTHDEKIHYRLLLGNEPQDYMIRRCV